MKNIKKYWPADLHLIGKDIVRFHTIYWPIILMALGEPLPKQVFGHPWLMVGDSKMSKSGGNLIYADDLANIFGVDAVRYFVLNEMPFENDGSITWDLLVERINSDLANTLGNLVNRTVAMSKKYFGGVVENTGIKEPVDDELKNMAAGLRDKVAGKMDEFKASDALGEIFALFKRCNKYIDETEPWKLGKDENAKERLAAVLYNLTDSILIGASLLEPFMPSTAKRIADQLNVPLASWDELSHTDVYPSGNKLSETSEILFARLDTAVIAEKSTSFTVKYSSACVNLNL